MMFYPHAADAETFKSAEFLTWEQKSQDLYIHTSVAMAGLISSKNDKKHMRCLEDWYFGADDIIKTALAVIDETAEEAEHAIIGTWDGADEQSEFHEDILIFNADVSNAKNEWRVSSHLDAIL